MAYTNAEIRAIQAEVNAVPVSSLSELYKKNEVFDKYSPNMSSENLAYYQSIVSQQHTTDLAEFEQHRIGFWEEHPKDLGLLSDIGQIAMYGIGGVMTAGAVSGLLGGSTSLFGSGVPAAKTGYVAGPGGDVAALAMENQVVSAASPEFSAFALQAESEFLAPEAVGLAAEPSFWDKLWSAGASVGKVAGSAANVYSTFKEKAGEVQQIFSPVITSEYPDVADSIVPQVYTKLEDQGQITGATVAPGAPAGILAGIDPKIVLFVTVGVGVILIAARIFKK